ncbi:MAG TPA: helix-turn-helix transcriptional regulator [Niastella sp.]
MNKDYRERVYSSAKIGKILIEALKHLTFFINFLHLTIMTNAEKEILESFGANLRKIRMAKGHSLRTLYAASGIDNSALGRMERGETNVTILTIVKLAQVLEVDLSELISTKLLNL